MRTKIFSFVLPVAAFVLASAGAVGTKMTDSSKSANPPITGWTHGASSCQDPVPCKTEVDVFCTDGAGNRAYLMTSPNQCNIDLYKR